jgi:hypothetical protein
MISSVTITIVGVFAIIFAVMIIGFILLMRQSSERPRRFRPPRQEKREDQRSSNVSSGYVPYKDNPEPRDRRRDSMIVIGIIILFIIISILGSFL